MPIVVVVPGDPSSFTNQDFVIFQGMFREEVEETVGFNEYV